MCTLAQHRYENDDSQATGTEAVDGQTGAIFFAEPADVQWLAAPDSYAQHVSLVNLDLLFDSYSQSQLFQKQQSAHGQSQSEDQSSMLSLTNSREPAQTMEARLLGLESMRLLENSIPWSSSIEISPICISTMPPIHGKISTPCTRLPVDVAGRQHELPQQALPAAVDPTLLYILHLMLQ
jgi:hypothetical protein